MHESDSMITVIGCGPGSRDYLTAAAVQAVAEAGVVIGPQKLINLFEQVPERVVQSGKTSGHTLDKIKRYSEHDRVAVLVSGDPGCFSLSSLVVERFGLARCRIIPGISSVQLGMSRLGLDWTGANIISVHGRSPDQAARSVCEHKPCVVLLGKDLHWLEPLLEQLLMCKIIYLMQNLGLSAETISTVGNMHDLKQPISPSALLVVLQKQDCNRD